MGRILTRKLNKLDYIIDNGGIYELSVWKDGNHVDGDLWINCFDDAVELAEENDADEIEAAVWYSEDDYNNRTLVDNFIIVWSKY